MSTDSDNRQRILDAAHALFAESGLAGLSVRAIAARAGLSTIGVYSHFKGKRGILLALYADGFARLGDAADIAPQVAEGADLVALLVNRYIDFHRDHAAHYQRQHQRTHLDDCGKSCRLDHPRRISPRESTNAVIGSAAYSDSIANETSSRLARSGGDSEVNEATR